VFEEKQEATPAESSPADSSPEPSPETAEQIDLGDADTRVRWWHRIGVIGWSRWLLLVAGLALLVFGVFDAWRSEASTTLLIVGGLFVLFAVIVGQDWREIRLSHGDTTAQIFRGVDQALERVEKSSDTEIRAQVAELRTELTSIARRTAPRAVIANPPFPTRVSERSSPVTGPGLFGGKPVAYHTFGSSWVQLSLGVPARDTNHSYTCVITPPDDTTWMKSISPPIFRGIPWTFSTVFPDEFVGSNPLVPGSYRVEWRQGAFPEPAPGASQLAAVLALKLTLQRLALVATDAFTIPDTAQRESATPTKSDEGH
jgi:hypothetical protein